MDSVSNLNDGMTLQSEFDESLIETSGRDAYYYCDVCNERFNSVGALNFHKTSFHYDKWKGDDSKQYDAGQNDLRNGVSWLWSQFKEEHALPDVIFAYEQNMDNDMQVWVANKTVMPLYFKDKCKDLKTGLMHDMISFGYQWMLLDPYAKVSSLAHTAAHIEIDLAGPHIKRCEHGRKFKRVSESYDLECTMVGGYWNATYANSAFKRKHRGPIRLISRYHPMQVMTGAPYLTCYNNKRIVNAIPDLV